jgi:ketosteroid isomerase-like protein
MKLCPACQTQYTDDTLQFCLQDGTPLTLARQADTPTVVLSETETRATLGGGRFQVPINDAHTGEQPLNHVVGPPRKKETNTAIAVMLTVVGMLILFGVVGIGAWFYFRNPQQQIVPNKTVINATPNVNVNPSQTPKPARSPTPTPTENTNTSPPRVDDSRVPGEIKARLDSWKSQSEALDLDAYMEHYAPVVDYYNKPSSTSAYVRADKARAFSRYDSIKIKLSNITVTTEPDGETATATFDKEWDFQGSGSSSGKVRQMIRFRRINGEWLITAEKDLKLFYKN